MLNIENMGGRDQSQVKIKFKKFEKIKSVPRDVPKSHNNDRYEFQVNKLVDVVGWQVRD